MKVILTGVTGFIGSEVLTQCLCDPTITSVVALSRRPLLADITKDPKVSVVIMEDFTVYSEEVISKMEGADACIWATGTREALETETTYPLAFCNAIALSVARQKKPFRYIHLSGILAEKDQSKCLLFLQKYRHVKGRAELSVLDFQSNEAKLRGGYWQSFIVKPSMVLPKKGEKSDLRWLGSVFIGSVDVDELAAAMIDIGRNGSEEQIFNNAECVMRGRAALDMERERAGKGWNIREKGGWGLW
jgi:hypothetical protein